VYNGVAIAKNEQKGEPAMTINEKIRELRKKANLTQEALAAALNISYQSVSKWESGVSHS
jgi:DNA-binding transcriptional regulator YiaG